MLKQKLIPTAVFAVLFVVITFGLQAADLYVTTTTDQVAGSLRAAITTANSTNEDTTIHLPAGTYILTGAAGEDANVSGDLDISTTYTITITGANKKTTIIDGDAKDRVLHILDGAVIIYGITVKNGKTPQGTLESGNADHGGGIINNGNLTLKNCIISNNATGDGFDCHANNNQEGGNGGNGGGIANFGSLSIQNCTVENNSSGNGGDADSYPPMGLCCFNPGAGGDGGGIYNNNQLHIKDSTVRYNKTGNSGSSCHNQGSCGNPRGGNGGGIYNSGTLGASRCTIHQNATGSAIDSGCDGACSGDGGSGGGIYSSGAFSLTDSTISNNSTGIGAFDSSLFIGEGGHGGGIYNSGGNSSLSNCTISGNLTTSYSTYDLSPAHGSISSLTPSGTGSGGGVFNLGKNLVITCCTIYNNETGNPAWDYQYVFGGGIYSDPSGTIKLENTLVANNRVGEKGSGADCYGTLESRGYNLIEDTDGCTFTGILTGNISGVDARVVPLANNGGSTRTHALLPDSPAIDAGNSSNMTTDQRGHSRPVDIPGIANVSDAADIGAYEFDAFYIISGKVTQGDAGLPGVTLAFSNNGGGAVTSADGVYSHIVPYKWTGTVTPSLAGYIFTPSFRSYSSINSNWSNQDYSAGNITPPGLALNRTRLNFGVLQAGNIPGAQRVLISNTGGGVLNWTASSDASWISFTPSSGTGDSILNVSIAPTGLAVGSYSTTIAITDPNAVNSPQTINVSLHVYGQGQGSTPFGEFSTPLDGASVYNCIPVTGWVLDDVEIQSVYIYNSNTIIGIADFVTGARPDVETAYPDYPFNYKAGWGYMLLTHALPNGGNGTYTLIAKATDIDGNEVTLGSKTITVDNAHAVKPFGAIDWPESGGTVSGKNCKNIGWALTPQPNIIPLDGSTIDVVIDGMVKGHPVYNIPRSDIQWFFPGYANTDGAMGYYYFDTTKLANGVHTIAWIVTDSAGNSDGIGSRYFTVENSGNSGAREKRRGAPACAPVFEPYSLAFDPYLHSLTFDEAKSIEIKELERLEINLSDEGVSEGYLVVGDRLKELPIGSSLDRDRGIFYWQPGPGFVGEYRFLFLEKDYDGKLTRKNIFVNIKPKK